MNQLFITVISKKDAKVTQLKQKIMIQFGHLFSDRNANCIVIIY